MEQAISGLFTDLVVFSEEIPSRNASILSLSSPLPESIASLLPDKLYSHQALAIDAALSGHDVMVVTGTNSGKSLCYQVPAMVHCVQEPMARGLLVFPTKALAQDQLQRLQGWGKQLHFSAATYDGDSPASRRAAVRNQTNLVLTNPDMLHVGILPNHSNWNRFFKSLRIIVLDEIHVYRGVFGSHVAWVLRRLLRLCERNGNRPQIIACSATIGNPEQLFRDLTGRSPVLIDQDGSPSGRRSLYFLNPPIIAESQAEESRIQQTARLSTNQATALALSQLVETRVTTLAFNRSRLATELVLRRTQSMLPEALARKVDSYRGGYTPKERRGIEKKLMQGELLGLSSTNALELGVDIGNLDAVILNGYPGSVSSFWQQIGRAGRGARDSVAIWIGAEDPFEQHLMKHPEGLISRRSEKILIDPENPNIAEKHLVCGAFESPWLPSELSSLEFGQDTAPLGLRSSALDLAESLDRRGTLRFQSGQFFLAGCAALGNSLNPASEVPLRNSGRLQYSILLDDGSNSSLVDLGKIDSVRAMHECHPGAIYLHRGQSFEVHTLEIDRQRAILKPFEGKYYTQSKTQSTIESGHAFAQAGPLSISTCRVTEQVIGYVKKRFEGAEPVDILPLELPPHSFDTVGIRIDLPSIQVDDLVPQVIAGIHGVEHALLALAPWYAHCVRHDLGSGWYTTYPDTVAPAVFIFDRIEGGIGLSSELFRQANAWIDAAFSMVFGCSCTSGCPSCLWLTQCELNNDAIDKQETIRLLKWILQEMK